MKYKVKFEKYINFSLISNCIIFNTLAGCCKNKNKNKNEKKESCCKKKTNIENNISNNDNNEDLNKKTDNPDPNKKPDDDGNDDPKETEEEKDKKKDEEKEKDPNVENKNQEEELINENEKLKLLTEYDNLVNDVNNLKNYSSNKFNIQEVTVLRKDIKNCKKKDYKDINNKLETNKTSFNTKISEIFENLKNKYQVLKSKITEDNKYDCKNIEDIINKSNPKVEDIKNLDNLLISLDSFITNGINGLIKTTTDKFESLKPKFEFAKKNIKDFNYNLDETINKLKILTENKKIQELDNEVNNKDNEINNYINTEYKKTLEDKLKNIKEENNHIVCIFKNYFDNLFEKDYCLIEINYNIPNDITYENIIAIEKELTKLDKSNTDFLKEENLVKLIEQKLNSKLTNFTVDKEDKDKDSKILNGLYICTLFNKKVSTLPEHTFKKIENIAEFKNKLMNFYNNHLTYYKEHMQVNKLYIYTDTYGLDKIFYIFEKTDKDEIEKQEFVTETKKINDTLEYDHRINDNTYSSYYFKNIEDFNKIFKKDKKYKDIFFLDFDYSNKKRSYLLFFAVNYKDKTPTLNYIYSDKGNYDNLFKKSLFEEIVILYNNEVNDLSNMFYDSENLKKLDLSNFNTKDVTKMSYMFKGCKLLEELNLDNFNTSNVTDMRSMFSGCKLLKELKLDKFDTSNVTDMYCMFYDCSNLENITFGDKFNTSNVTNMNNMFSNCKLLKELKLDKFDTSNVTNMYYMFYNCSNLENITFGDKFNTSNVTNMNFMFYNCENLNTLNISNFNLSNNSLEVCKMFYNCNKINRDSVKSIFDKFKKEYNEKDLFETK